MRRAPMSALPFALARVGLWRAARLPKPPDDRRRRRAWLLVDESGNTVEEDEDHLLARDSAFGRAGVFPRHDVNDDANDANDANDLLPPPTRWTSAARWRL